MTKKMTADRFGIADVALISKIICASKMERCYWLFSFRLLTFGFPSIAAPKILEISKIFGAEKTLERRIFLKIRLAFPTKTRYPSDIPGMYNKMVASFIPCGCSGYATSMYING
jgi:hypothetical protein